MRRLLQAMAMLAGCAVLAAAPTATKRIEDSGSAKVGGMAPSFGGWDLAGKNVLSFDKLRKTPAPAPLLVTFGASFCAPCKLGLPRLAALQRKHPADFRLVLIDVDPDAQRAMEFRDASNLDPAWPAIHDKFSVIAKSYGVNQESETSAKSNMPRTFLISAKGRIVAIYSLEGPDFEAVIEEDLKKALALTSDDAPPLAPPAAPK
jgi:thiol-disulfide isomerase/thioredoxin